MQLTVRHPDSGHCSRRGPGTSSMSSTCCLLPSLLIGIVAITFRDGNWRYEEDGVERAGPPCKAIPSISVGFHLTTGPQISLLAALSESTERYGHTTVLEIRS